MDRDKLWDANIDVKAGTVAVEGEIDYSVSPELRRMLHEFIAASNGEVRIDLGSLEYLDSSGLAVLIEARRMLQEQDRTLVITKVTPQVEKVFQLTQVSSLFGI